MVHVNTLDVRFLSEDARNQQDPYRPAVSVYIIWLNGYVNSGCFDCGLVQEWGEIKRLNH